MGEIHRDKNGNPLKGAALHSHIIYTHDGGPEAHDTAIFRDAFKLGYQKANRERMDARHIVRKKRQSNISYKDL